MVELQQLVQWRRYLHRNPELSFQEHRTSVYLEQELRAMGIETHKLSPTGVIGIVNSGKPGPAVALRADIDALPLQDAKTVEYKSQVEGVMHACGHDGHTAILLGVAKALADTRPELQGKVILIFQPAEEKPPGGAVSVIEQGWLQGVDWIFGLHLWAGLPVGYVGLSTGPVMANADEFSIKVIGRGGHGSMPQDTVDSILVASQIVVALQTVVSRSVKPMEPAVVSVGSINGGTGFNIIAQETVIKGTYRSFSEGTRLVIENRIGEIAQGICATWGAKCEVNCHRGYPAVVNPQKGVDVLKAAAVKVVGESRILSLEPSLGGEDFAYYLQSTPGAFMLLGATGGEVFPHHHPCFDFTEEAMLTGVEVLISAVREALAQPITAMEIHNNG